MLYWIVVFFIVATIAAMLGLGVTGASTGLVQIILFILIAFLVIALTTGYIRRSR